jgi:hypothetical protein
MRTTVTWNSQSYEVELVERESPYDRLRVGHVGTTGVQIELRNHADVVRDFWTATAVLRPRGVFLFGVTAEIRVSGGEYRQNAVDALARIVARLEDLEIHRPVREPVRADQARQEK